MEQVVLVDVSDNEVGTMEKLQAHVEGVLHRAISVFIFNGRGELLLQQRAAGKYHSALQWTNTCCSHPRPGEEPLAAANRRLREEMGIVCELTPAFTFVYKAAFSNGLTEHEFDHVFIGHYEGDIIPDADEVADWKYMSKEEIMQSIAEEPETFTPWFIICIQQNQKELFKN
jgi:isopentenyl-diphosphate Delta-isomerase